MTCESDGDIKTMLALLQVEGLGAPADKPLGHGMLARASAYMKGIDSLTAQKKALEAKVTELEEDLKRAENEAYTAGVDRDKARAQLSQLRADVAREKKEKEAQEHAVLREKAEKEAHGEERRRREVAADIARRTRVEKEKADRKAREEAEAERRKSETPEETKEREMKEWFEMNRRMDAHRYGR